MRFCHKAVWSQLWASLMTIAEQVYDTAVHQVVGFISKPAPRYVVQR